MMSRLFKSILLLCSIHAGLIHAGELSSKLVSTGWLRSNITKENLRIIDIRSAQAYSMNHLPGAINLNPESFREQIANTPAHPVKKETIADILGSSGVEDNSIVIIYGGATDVQPFYMLWLFDYIGHTAVALLDGGIDRWEQENRPVTQTVPQIKKVRYRLDEPDEFSTRSSKEDILQAIKTNSSVLIDTESPEIFAGNDGSFNRKGHVKGAVNCYWKNDITELYSWKRPDILKTTYSRYEVFSGKKVILLCNDGWSAAHSYFTLRYILGISSVSIYDGGMCEWANDNEMPMTSNALLIQSAGPGF